MSIAHDVELATIGLAVIPVDQAALAGAEQQFLHQAGTVVGALKHMGEGEKIWSCRRVDQHGGDENL